MTCHKALTRRGPFIFAKALRWSGPALICHTGLESYLETKV